MPIIKLVSSPQISLAISQDFIGRYPDPALFISNSVHQKHAKIKTIIIQALCAHAPGASWS